MLAQYKQETIQLYTLTEAEKIIEYNRKMEVKRRKHNALYSIKQRLAGLLLLLIGIITPLICAGDATINLFTLPIGLLLLFTNQRIMVF